MNMIGKDKKYITARNKSLKWTKIFYAAQFCKKAVSF